VVSSGVVKDDPKRSALARSDVADAVTVLDPIETASASYGAVADWKDHGITLFERHDLGPRLAPRPLLGKDELAAGELGRA